MVCYARPKILTGAVQARGPDASVVFALAQNLIQHLLLLLAKVDLSIVGAARRCGDCWRFVGCGENGEWLVCK